ncbi:hypothetical protein Poli38472_006869 [Pythium oligandrum]|uniref:Uncharacterized protein n=1 Tax=Pythium oligandrum TaxID=41045 RepID=A0A8K1C5C6_PYTOL|nr:hypothetical protein Poli38472_006869 [Pythium oligandrum]|eukprot:TMW56859.1 hypothetical protein Poli38472_006869 [Pythium oligandrum]
MKVILNKLAKYTAMVAAVFSTTATQDAEDLFESESSALRGTPSMSVAWTADGMMEDMEQEKVDSREISDVVERMVQVVIDRTDISEVKEVLDALVEIVSTTNMTDYIQIKAIDVIAPIPTIEIAQKIIMEENTTSIGSTDASNQQEDTQDASIHEKVEDNPEENPEAEADLETTSTVSIKPMEAIMREMNNNDAHEGIVIE